MSHATQASTTHADQLAQSPAVRSAIETISAELRAHSARITDIREPIEGLGASYESMLQRAAATRGRGLMYPYIGSGLGNGPLVELADGSVKWDMICGIGVYFFGHSDPEMTEVALHAALEDTQRQGNLQSTFEAFEFAETLVAEASKTSSLAHCFLTPTGALANENALKICYQKAMPASRVIVFKDCFMGRTATMAQLGDNAAYRSGVPLTVGVDYMPFFDTVAADRIGQTKYIDMALMHLQQYIDRYPGEHAAFVFELVQGEGGFHTSTRDYFVQLMDCCRANGIAVWDDEIQTFGRTERLFAYEMLDLGEHIDVLCLGKMTQVCATLYTEAMNPKPGLLSGTFTGDPAGLAVGRRLVERLRDGGHYGPEGKHAEHHKCFSQQVRALAERHPDWFPPVPETPGSPGVPDIVGGVGGMMRLTPFGGDKAAIGKACRACYDEGVILFSCGHGPYHIRMLPPLGVMDPADWPGVFACVERGLASVAAGLGS